MSVLQYQEEGYLPEALLNYLVRLGWSHGDQEIFTLEEMMRLFDIKDVNKSASAFNPEKLLWLNQQHIMSAPVPKRWLQICVSSWHDWAWHTDDQTLLQGVANASVSAPKPSKRWRRTACFFFRDFDGYDDEAAAKNLTAEAAADARRRWSEGLAALSDWNAGSAFMRCIDRVAAHCKWHRQGGSAAACGCLRRRRYRRPSMPLGCSVGKARTPAVAAAASSGHRITTESSVDVIALARPAGLHRAGIP